MPEAAKQCTTVEEELLRLLLLLPFSLALLLFSAIFVRMLPRHHVNLVQLLIITAAVKSLHSILNVLPIAEEDFYFLAVNFCSFFACAAK